MTDYGKILRGAFVVLKIYDIYLFQALPKIK